MGATPSLSQRHRNFNHGQMPWLSLWNISLVLSCRYSTNGADFWLYFGNQGLPNPSVWWVYRSVMVYWSNERPETENLGCWGGYHKKITIRHFFWDTLYDLVQAAPHQPSQSLETQIKQNLAQMKWIFVLFFCRNQTPWPCLARATTGRFKKIKSEDHWGRTEIQIVSDERWKCAKLVLI